MARIPSYRALQRHFSVQSDDIKAHFARLDDFIANQRDYEIAIAYSFFKLELGQVRALYGGLVKSHRANAPLARRFLDQQHITREKFRELFKNVFGKAISQETMQMINRPEKIRDKIIHGKIVQDSDIREAIADVLDYASSLNTEVAESAQFKPFGDMRGFKGRNDSLDKSTTKWMMKGMGFTGVS